MKASAGSNSMSTVVAREKKSAQRAVLPRTQGVLSFNTFPKK